jgi:L-aminopeptidase/D-esterase-like protein
LFPDVEPARGGLGIGHASISEQVTVTALVAVNAAGEVVLDAGAPDLRQELLASQPVTPARVATTIGVVLIDAPVDERTLVRCVTSAHAGLSRVVRPSHTILDGDTMFAVGMRTGNVELSDVLRFSVAVELAVERAIIDAVTA